jgi:cytoskeletal protein CcmA (bactofilin family)
MFREKGEAISMDTITTDKTTVLKQDASFEGKLMFEGDVLVDGKFKGEIFSEGELTVGSSGYVEGDIEIGTIKVLGEIRGNIKASSKIIINAPAVVRGDIQAPSLIIEEGAVFEGNCTMGNSQQIKKAEPVSMQNDNVVDLLTAEGED